ncbi:DEAD/DEAH box helicase [Streptomyces mirabilis]|uniref:DEAD/DEAH box helicase n=1 Tax=Streptomyces mirabilis TaxID=68239 RepID=UPI0021BE755A|nr:DEAD/DEAH box helicase [Streptomyces mirabilis]MCT9105309.1 Helicase associated domain protein [Streptomyces mirabilis]
MNDRSTPVHGRKSASRMIPRPHQEEALRAIRETSEGRALVVMACGTGKSLVARETASARTASTVLVTVPTLALAEQIYRGWASRFPDGLDALIVCSDSAVGGAAAPVTVEPGRIADLLAPRQSTRMRLLISTYHSVGRIAEAYTLHALPPLDLVVLDEAHHTAGRAGKAYSAVLDNARIPAVFRLSLTATSRIHEGSDGTTDIVSMDDEELYGKRVYELSFGSAIQRKLLADYEVAIVLVSDQDVHATLLAQDGGSHASSRSSDAATVAAQIALSQAMHEHDLRQVIAFHSRVARSKAFSATLGTIGATSAKVRITSLHMDGRTPAATRNSQLEMLASPARGRRVVLNNVRTLTEGVDVSSVDGICLVDPKSSQTDIVQAVGRALRLHPDHDRPALILLPVYVAPGESPQAVLEASSFRHVWRVLATLRDQDERMDAALTTARRRLSSDVAENAGIAQAVLPEKVRIYGSTNIDARFVAALGVHVLENTTEDWYHFYGLLERYAATHGHTAVPTSTDSGTLESWAARQRGLYAVGKLPPKRAALLEAQPGWTWRLAEFKRELGRSELERFVAERGHARVPRGYTVPDTGYRLDNFVTLARNRHKAGQMDTEEIAYYEAFPGWMWHAHDAKFEAFLQHLDAFIAEHDHARVPQAYKVEKDGIVFALGHTVTRKRTDYRKGTLPPAQAEALEERSEWVWDGIAAQWEASFDVLAFWAAEHGDIKVPFDQSINGIGIYRWMLQQKKLIREGKQPEDRRRRLEALPGWSTS